MPGIDDFFGIFRRLTRPRPAPSHAPVAERTTLTRAEDRAYRQWLVDSEIDDADAPEARYDYPGLFRQVAGKPIPNWEGRHFPDMFKQHGHEAFSAESQYSRGPQDGGQWLAGGMLGGRQVEIPEEDQALVGPPAASHDVQEPNFRVSVEGDLSKLAEQFGGEMVPVRSNEAPPTPMTPVRSNRLPPGIRPQPGPAGGRPFSAAEFLPGAPPVQPEQDVLRDVTRKATGIGPSRSPRPLPGIFETRTAPEEGYAPGPFEQIFNPGVAWKAKMDTPDPDQPTPGTEFPLTTLARDAGLSGDNMLANIAASPLAFTGAAREAELMERLGKAFGNIKNPATPKQLLGVARSAGAKAAELKPLEEWLATRGTQATTGQEVLGFLRSDVGAPGRAGPFTWEQDISDKYPIINEMRAPSEQNVKSIRNKLRAQGRLNSDGTVSLYHVTLSDPDSIRKHGLVPAFEAAPGQDWEAEHRKYATYFFLDKEHAIDQLRQSGAGSVVEARVPLNRSTLSRFIPDEDSSPNIYDGLKVLTEGGSVAFIGGVPPSSVSITHGDLGRASRAAGQATPEQAGGYMARFGVTGNVDDAIGAARAAGLAAERVGAMRGGHEVQIEGQMEAVRDWLKQYNITPHMSEATLTAPADHVVRAFAEATPNAEMGEELERVGRLPSPSAAREGLPPRTAADAPEANQRTIRMTVPDGVDISLLNQGREQSLRITQVGPEKIEVTGARATVNDFLEDLDLDADDFENIAPRPEAPQADSASQSPTYSRLVRAVEALPERVHPNKVLATAKAAASGDEIAWKMLPEWLAQQGDKPIERQKVLDYLKSKQINLNVSKLGDPGASPLGATRTGEWADREIQIRGSDEPIHIFSTYLNNNEIKRQPAKFAQAIFDSLPHGQNAAGEVIAQIPGSAAYIDLEGEATLEELKAIVESPDDQAMMWEEVLPKPVLEQVQAKAGMRGGASVLVPGEYDQYMPSAYQPGAPSYNSLDEAEAEVRRIFTEKVKGQARPVKYEEHTLPGGENYREVLITMKRAQGGAQIDHQDFMDWHYKQYGRKVHPDLVAAMLSEDTSTRRAYFKDRAMLDEPYHSPHWRNDQDVVVHVRHKDRVLGGTQVGQKLPPNTRLVESDGRWTVEARELDDDGRWLTNGKWLSAGFGPTREAAIADFSRKMQPYAGGDVMLPDVAGGSRGRFIEEVQSDWGQAGKKTGYRASGSERTRLQQQLREAEELHMETTEDLSAARDKAAHGNPGDPEWDQIERELERAKNRRYQVGDTPGRVQAEREYDALITKQKQLHQKYVQEVEQAEKINSDAYMNYKSLRDKANAGVPNMPFKETWPDLALKQQLVEVAQDPNLEWIGFTGGQTQADRYNLSRHVSRIEYDRDASRLKGIDANGQTIINELGIEPGNLEDYIGREPAQKLMEQINQREKLRAGYEVVQKDAGDWRVKTNDGEGARQFLSKFAAEGWVMDNVSVTASLQDADLDIGGEGMRKFYDEILPKRLEKLVKPLGGKVEKSTIGAGDTWGKEKNKIARQIYDHLRAEYPVGAREVRVHTVYRRGGVEGIMHGGPATDGDDFTLSLMDIKNAINEDGLGPASIDPAILKAINFKASGDYFWLVRLTPQMKKSILKSGLPLMVGALGVKAVTDQDRER